MTKTIGGETGRSYNKSTKSTNQIEFEEQLASQRECFQEDLIGEEKKKKKERKGQPKRKRLCH